MGRRMSSVCAGAVTTMLLAASAWAGDWPTWGGRADRNMVSDETGLPDRFDGGAARPGATTQSAKLNLKWVAPLGSQTWSTPVIAGGRVYIGTNNGNPRDRRFGGDRGVFLCLNEADGSLVWQLVTRRAEYRDVGQVSTQTVEGGRVYLLTGLADMLCLDAGGLADGNDGPFTDEATYLARSALPPPKATTQSQAAPEPPAPPPIMLAPTDADVIWRFEAMPALNLYPHDTTNSSALILGETLFIGTGNGVSSWNRRIPESTVPSVMALDKRTGKLLAIDDQCIGRRMWHGGWCSPSYGVVDGRAMVFFGGADGWLYAFDPRIGPPAATTRPATSAPSSQPAVPRRQPGIRDQVSGRREPFDGSDVRQDRHRRYHADPPHLIHPLRLGPLVVHGLHGLFHLLTPLGQLL